MSTFKASDYKRTKEKFLAGNLGTGPIEPLLIIAVSVCTFLFTKTIINLLVHHGKKISHKMIGVLEFMMIVVPCIFIICFPDFGLPIIIGTLGFCLIIHFKVMPVFNCLQSDHLNPKRPSMIGRSRVVLMLYTTISIMGVNFHVYPRKFAKTELFGFALMDVGVGSFVIVNALISRPVVAAALADGSKKAKPTEQREEDKKGINKSQNHNLDLDQNAISDQSDKKLSRNDNYEGYMPNNHVSSMNLLARLKQVQKNVLLPVIKLRQRYKLQRFWKKKQHHPQRNEKSQGVKTNPNSCNNGEVRRKRQRPNFFKVFNKAVLSSLPLFVIGFFRYAVIAGTNYQTHVTEYGVHWNFFITLGVVGFFSTILLTYINPKYGIAIGLIILAAHQYILSNGVTDWIVNAKRISFLTKNKEGFGSVLGFVALFLMSCNLGYLFFQRKKDKRDWMKLFLYLITFDLVLWVLWYYVDHKIQPTSRRMVNMGYVFCELAVFTVMVIGFMLLDLFTVPYAPEVRQMLTHNGSNGNKSTSIMLSLNTNQLSIFLVANTFVGITNCTFQTIYFSKLSGFIYITLYMAAVVIIAIVNYIKNWKFKFWGRPPSDKKNNAIENNQNINSNLAQGKDISLEIQSLSKDLENNDSSIQKI
ncbi:phosphatidylinositol-glycan biosynthesis class w protein [Anaeramoeba flamelloides]|uniref:Phosphatidylinositol-glycan biosynthesis class w protein n=1 Tax=Anaeramoeba flamelloides TaxID=1746091 RepID=A0AAV7ZJ74_9EUKA|nr:phosphatidylinositol-glycan biosynthesis class w protein [Anaeramoeba flamelloides]